jgi:putative copper export protein
VAGAFSALTGWVLFAGLALTTGATLARWIILPRVHFGEGPSPEWLTQQTGRLASTAGLLLPVAMSFYFVRQLHEFRDPFAPWTADARLLLGATAWGRAWLWATAGSILSAIALFAAKAGKHAGWWAATPILLALGAFPGLTGHAAGEENLRALALLADAMHVWAAGGWIGGLAVVFYLDRRWRSESPDRTSLLPALVPAFSAVAMASVATLALTGTFAAWLHLPSMGSLFSTNYGRTLLLKLGLVGIVLALGGLNYKVLTPRLGTRQGNEQMRKAAAFELLVAQAVLLVTALLVRMSPMAH